MLQPVLDARQPIAHMMEVVVSAGQPVSLEIAGAAAELLAACPVHLGQQVGALEVLLKDEFGRAPAACLTSV